MPSLQEIVAIYDPTAPIEEAFTLPASWYTDGRVADLEWRTAFASNWQVFARTSQLREAGDFVTGFVAGEPVVVVRGDDGVLRGFFNVCGHHAAEVMVAPCGRTRHMTCPYHGWTYALDGTLVSAPQFGGARAFDRARFGLKPVVVEVLESWVFVRIAASGPSLAEFVGPAMIEGLRALDLPRLQWLERRRYTVECNWKVYVDNYLDGGYHVPHLHGGLDSVLEPGRYTIDCGERFCLQSSAIRARDAANPVSGVRGGERAHYYWLYPNFMINWYEGVMDTNVVVPMGVDRCEVVFDYWFADAGEPALERNRASMAVSERIQDEDAAVCASVQRGLRSRAYDAGRLSPKREAGEHLFHRLLAADLRMGLEPGASAAGELSGLR